MAKFAPIPARATKDVRLSGRHWRVLAAVAGYNRLGKNSRGCFAGRRRLAQDSSCAENHVSEALSDLRAWGYISSSPTDDKRSKVHRIIWDASQIQDLNASQIRDGLSENRSRKSGKCVPTQNANGLETSSKTVPNIDKTNTDIRGRLNDLNRAEARKPGRMAEAEAASYLDSLSGIESSALQFERQGLTAIADNEALPETLRERARGLRCTI